ncbi:hypothetical protein [Aminobacter ciceronei]|uniref:hypothetical protein n=1 Tax=Aminobacter ciceronei TaxID=150723 RepID=UPI001AEEC8E5|nr:hypothetical protein [Aminobacter ciceronei]
MALLMLLANPRLIHAQEAFDTLRVEIDPNVQVDKLPPLVFVNGTLAAAIEGLTSVPSESESVIEVGLPQARQPLYSFKIGPEQIEKKLVSVVMTTYASKDGSPDQVWTNVLIHPNVKEDVPLRRAETGEFEITLPAMPYAGFSETLAKFGLNSTSANWIEAIPDVNDMSKQSGILHLSQTIGDTATTWSGSYSTALRASWPPPAYEVRDWKITSTPVGATIFTQHGHEGNTNRTVTLPNLSETYVTLRLDGYLDCPHTQCSKMDRGGYIDLNCTLKKPKKKK